MPHTFKISDESLNSYGFWVKSAGINLARFNSNPVMLYDHNQYSMPIGRWENLRIENGELLADAVFDTEDERANEIARKVEKGFIKGASVGLKVDEMSQGPELMKPGQTRPTLTKSTLMEISITPFPSNANALKLHDAEGEQINLSGVGNKAIDNVLPTINLNTKMKEVNLKLGIAEDADQAMAVAAVQSLQDENKALKAKLTTLFEKLGEATGSITDENRERMMKLAANDFDLALDFLKPAQKADDKKDEGEKKDTSKTDLRLSDLIKELAGKGNNDPEKDYDWYQKKDPVALNEMREKEPEKFQKLFDEHFKEA